MKFSQLKVGDEFLLEGEIYIKNTPLIANHSITGKPKMVARYLDVEPVSASSQQETAGLGTPHEAMDFFVSVLSRAIKNSPLSAAAKSMVSEEIVKAKAETLSKLS